MFVSHFSIFNYCNTLLKFGQIFWEHLRAHLNINIQISIYQEMEEVLQI